MLRLKSIIIILAFFTIAGGVYAEERIITPETVKSWLDKKKDFVLIDVRPPESFDEEHIPGAVNVPADDIAKVSKFKTKTIVLYCWSEGLSSLMAKDLKGYDVYVLKDGIDGWSEKGYKTLKRTTTH